jgi:nucleotide-binding universal stress UspA family protein
MVLGLFRRIVVGYDGSEHSRRALDAAVDLAKMYGAVVHVITVIDIASISSDPAAVGIVRETANQISSEASERLSRDGVDHSVYIRQGDPGDEIIKLAEEIKADLIIVGSRGLSKLKRIFLGSVSQKVVSRSRVPVLVVK